MMARWTWIAWDTGVPERNIKDGKVNHQNINVHVFSLLWDPTDNFENVWCRQRLGIWCLKIGQTPKIVMLPAVFFFRLCFQSPMVSPFSLPFLWQSRSEVSIQSSCLSGLSFAAEIALTSSLKKRLQTWQLSSCRCDSMAQCQPQMINPSVCWKAIYQSNSHREESPSDWIKRMIVQCIPVPKYWKKAYSQNTRTTLVMFIINKHFFYWVF